MAASEIKLIPAGEFRGYDKARMIEAEAGFRKLIADSRMDIYGQRTNSKTGIVRKNLARLLTVKAEILRSAAPVVKAAAPKATPVAKKAKPAKKAATAKAPKTKKAGK